MSLMGAIAAQTGYQSDFEALTASTTGTAMAGQDGFYVPAVAGSIDGALYTYTGNTLGVPANPNGGNNFWAGASQGGTAFARSQRAVTLPTGLVKVSYDICCRYIGAAAPTNNIGSFSFQPSTNALYVNLVAAYPTGVPNPPTTWDALVITRGATPPATVTTTLPNPAFQGLAMDVWHTWSCTVNMATGEHVEFSIRNGSTGITTTYKPSTPLLMPVAPTAPGLVPTDFRLFGGGGLGNVFAIDNLNITDGAAVADAIGEGCPYAHSFYENFAAGALDLAGKSITMTPTVGGGYTVAPGGAFIPVGSIGTPVTLALTDDSQATHTLTTGTFPGWTALTVCSNGFVSQATGNGTGFTPAVATMLGNAQTGFYSWHDYNPASGGSGQVKVEESATVTTVTWDGVFSFGTTSGAHTFQFQFYPSGQVTIAYGAMAGNGNGHLVGYSPGGPSANPGNSDLSGLGSITLSAPGVNKAPLRLAAATRPIQGGSATAYSVTTSNIPASAAIHLGLIGLSNPNASLAPFGMTDCNLYSSADVLDAQLLAPGSSTQSWTPIVLPALPPSVSGFTFFLQSAILGTTENSAFGFGALSSNGLRCIAGLN